MKLEIKITDVNVAFMANIQKRFGDRFKATGFLEDTQLFTAIFVEEFSQDAEDPKKNLLEMVGTVLKETDYEKLDTAIGDIVGLKTRALNCLERADVNTARKLTELTEEELLGIEGMGHDTVRNVIHVLTKMGLKLKE